MKQCNTSVVSTLDQLWNSATLLLSALSISYVVWNSATLLLSALSISSETVQCFSCQHSRLAMSYETVQHFCCQHSWSALEQCNTSVVSTLNQLCRMKQCNTSRLHKLSASPTSYGPVQHFLSYIRVCIDWPLKNFSPCQQTLKTTWNNFQRKTKFHRILTYSPFRFLFTCWINVRSTLYTSDYGSHWISSQRII